MVVGASFAAKYGVKWAAKGVGLSDDVADWLGFTAKIVTAVATLDVTGLALDAAVDSAVDLAVDSGAEHVANGFSAEHAANGFSQDLGADDPCLDDAIDKETCVDADDAFNADVNNGMDIDGMDVDHGVDGDSHCDDWHSLSFAMTSIGAFVYATMVGILMIPAKLAKLLLLLLMAILKFPWWLLRFLIQSMKILLLVLRNFKHWLAFLKCNLLKIKTASVVVVVGLIISNYHKILSRPSR
ncbi:hypothetical protein GOP47_0028476 [Adiantum capillus-veneris]|nr:hypothetical protein GOP47_0028476 [Adiantum capillus-veneris]